MKQKSRCFQVVCVWRRICERIRNFSLSALLSCANSHSYATPRARTISTLLFRNNLHPAGPKKTKLLYVVYGRNRHFGIVCFGSVVQLFSEMPSYPLCYGASGRERHCADNFLIPCISYLLSWRQLQTMTVRLSYFLISCFRSLHQNFSIFILERKFVYII